MVNTFLVCADFRENARLINMSRLGKQRVEAFQILNNIRNLRYLSELFEDPPPAPSYTSDLSKEFKLWISRIAHTYKSLGYLLVYREEKLFLYISGEEKEGDHLVKLGFVNHPATRAWYGYEDALKDYINACIEEWKQRGYKNNMETYSVPENYPRPAWTFDPEFHRIHRAALLKKELDRHEKPWYQLKEEFTSAGEFVDYIWP